MFSFISYLSQSDSEHLPLTSLRILLSDPDEWTLATADETVAVTLRESGEWFPGELQAIRDQGSLTCQHEVITKSLVDGNTELS